MCLLTRRSFNLQQVIKWDWELKLTQSPEISIKPRLKASSKSVISDVEKYILLELECPGGQ